MGQLSAEVQFGEGRGGNAPCTQLGKLRHKASRGRPRPLPGLARALWPWLPDAGGMANVWFVFPGPHRGLCACLHLADTRRPPGAVAALWGRVPRNRGPHCESRPCTATLREAARPASSHCQGPQERGPHLCTMPGPGRGLEGGACIMTSLVPSYLGTPKWNRGNPARGNDPAPTAAAWLQATPGK